MKKNAGIAGILGFNGSGVIRTNGSNVICENSSGLLTDNGAAAIYSSMSVAGKPAAVITGPSIWNYALPSAPTAITATPDHPDDHSGAPFRLLEGV